MTPVPSPTSLLPRYFHKTLRNLCSLASAAEIVFASTSACSERMIDRQLCDLLVADQVSPAVADAGDVDISPPLPPHGHDDRGAHVLHFLVQGPHRHDFFIRLDDRLADDGLGPLGVQLATVSDLRSSRGMISMARLLAISPAA